MLIAFGYNLLFAQLFEDMDNLHIFKDRFIFDPQNVNKVDGLWYNEVSDELFTGRLIIFSKEDKNNKISECTIISGVKSGAFIQYYNKNLMIEGIQGLYVNGKKEGPWKWVLPDHSYTNNPWRDSDSQIITSIEFRDGVRHGYISVDRATHSVGDNGKITKFSYLRNDILLRGQYRESKEYGEWFYNEYTLSDFDELSEPYDISTDLFYWSKREVYDNTGKLAYNECREPWDRDVDCKETSFNYFGSRAYIFPTPKKEELSSVENNEKKTFFIDDNGFEVEINVNSFKRHIKDYHPEGTSIHKQNGSTFTIDNDFRKMLSSKKG